MAITPAGSGAGLHPQAQPQGRSKAEDGAARLFLALGEVGGDYRNICIRMRDHDASKTAAPPLRGRADSGLIALSKAAGGALSSGDPL